MCVSSSAYLVRILLFGSNGPFEDVQKFVVDNGTHEGSVHLFDRIRRLFGAYQIEDTGEGTFVWRTTPRVGVFRCPKCLSFWVSFLVSVPFIFYLGTQSSDYFLLYPAVHLSITYWAQFLVFLQMTFEE
jgi:hypothetical protein